MKSGDVIAHRNGKNSDIYDFTGMVCARCDKPATVLIRGEVDSFGYEELWLCDVHSDDSTNELDAYVEALDVEDRPPKEGFVFIVNECNNADNGVHYYGEFTSYREAMSYYRECEQSAAYRAGLYPDAGVREIRKTTKQ
jgi:hypothetical protein